MIIKHDYKAEITYFKTDSSDLTALKRIADKDSIEWKFKFKNLWFTIDNEFLIKDLENYLNPGNTICDVGIKKFITPKIQKLLENRNIMLESLKSLM